MIRRLITLAKVIQFPDETSVFAQKLLRYLIDY